MTLVNSRPDGRQSAPSGRAHGQAARICSAVILSNVRGLSSGLHAAFATWWRSQEPRTWETMTALQFGPKKADPLSPFPLQRFEEIRTPPLKLNAARRGKRGGSSSRAGALKLRPPGFSRNRECRSWDRAPPVPATSLRARDPPISGDATLVP